MLPRLWLNQLLTFQLLLLTILLSACQQSGASNMAQNKTTEHTASFANKNNIALPTIPSDSPLWSLHLEWASTPAEREVGLMSRTKLDENAGMAFVFNQPGQHCFWMKNTLIPLSIGFFDMQGRLIQVENMAAQTTDIHCPKQAVRYALEVNQGWFERHRVESDVSWLTPHSPEQQ